MSDKKQEKKKQTMRYSDLELSLIKGTFADNEELIKAIRKVFLQLPLSAVDEAILQPTKNHPDVLKIIRKGFLPTLDGDAPLHQLSDIWMFAEIKNKTPHEVMLEVLSKQKLIEYLDQQLNFLAGDSKQDIKFVEWLNFDNKDEIEIYTNLHARNYLIAHTEMRLNEFQTLAGQKTETVEQTLERLRKDSSK